jgi:acyl transferase domain-containing protein
METIAPRYMMLMAKKVQAMHPKIPFYSSATCDVITNGADLGPAYWVKNLVSPVKFSTAVDNILGSIVAPKVFVEIGPHSALAGPIRQTLHRFKSNDEYVNTLTRGHDSYGELLKAIGELWLTDFQLDLEAIIGDGKFLTDLPLYPWHYEEPLWYESRLSKEWRLRQFPHHDILGSRIIESTDQDPSWRNILRLDVVPWIKEHEVAGDIVFPGVGYICMAGEAIRQLTGSTDFTARRIHIKAALVMHQGKDSELITQLQRAPITNAVDSKWYNFSVSSFNKGTWVKHVFGQVAAGTEYPRALPHLGPLPRVLSRRAWYRKMKVMGLEYGSRFMGLTNMSAHPIERKTIATVVNDIREGESTYAVHPVSLDCLLQAIVPATFNGLTRRFKHLGIPTYIEEIYVRPPPSSEMTIQARADEEPKAALSGDVTAMSEGQLVIELKGLQMSAIGDIEDAAGQDPHAAVELEWKEDLNLMDTSALIHQANDRSELHKKLDRFASACMLETAERLQGKQPTRVHLSQYFKWLKEIAEEILQDRYAGLVKGDGLIRASIEKRREIVETLYAELQDTEASATATAIYRIFNSSREIFTGETDELGLLLDDGVLNQLYDFMQNSEYAAFLDLLAHRKPNMKILEIGAGTGGTTATILPALQSAYGERMYLSYTYTDISSGFFPGAKQRFNAFPAMDYAVLDISKDPLEQGFEPETFDLVIACNVRLLYFGKETEERDC